MRHLLILTVLLIATACATPTDRVVTYSAKQLGVAYYFPQGSLTLKQLAADKFEGTRKMGNNVQRPSGQDAMLVYVLEILTLHCPVIQMASKSGASKVEIMYLPSQRAPDSPEFVATIVGATIPSSPSRGGNRVEVVDFMAPEWKFAQKSVCEKSATFNNGPIR